MAHRIIVNFTIGANHVMTNLSIEVLKLYTADKLVFTTEAIVLSLSTITVLIRLLFGSAGITNFADYFTCKNVTVISTGVCCVMNLLCII